MATGFKTATVNASDVPGTLANYPAYVDLSRLGITTLAEAQSVRVYAEAAKTTEWAREIVSATEMWVKIPSLTSTTPIYVDWDGARSDYTASDTYGRNAVWADYVAVYHLEEDPGGTAPQMIDSTGNGWNGTSGGTMTSADQVSGAVGNELDFDGSDDKIDLGDLDGAVVTAGVYTYSVIIKPDNTTGVQRIIDTSDDNTKGVGLFLNGTTLIFRHGDGTTGKNVTATYTNTSTYGHIVQRWDGSTLYGYVDGSSVGTPVSVSTINNSTNNTTLAHRAVTSGQEYDGRMDEVRVRASDVGANWITTEYNNLIDEAGFWGTWSTAAASTFTPKVMFF